MNHSVSNASSSAAKNNATWLGVAFIASLLFPVRVQYHWAFFSTIAILDLSLILVAAWLVLSWIFLRRIPVGAHQPFAILSLPVLFSVLSLAWTIDFIKTTKSIVVYGAALVAYLGVLGLFRSYSAGRLVKLVIIMAWLLIVTAIFSYLPGSPIAPEFVLLDVDVSSNINYLTSYYARFSHPFLGLSNGFATILVMLIPLVHAVRKIGLWGRASFWTLAVLLAALIATGSRGVLLSICVVYVPIWFWGLFKHGKIARSVFIGIIVVLVISGGFFLLSPEAVRHLSGRLSDSNIGVRMAAFSSALGAVSDEYPFGTGSGVELSSVGGLEMRSVHNAYLQNILWFGWIGGVLLSAAMWVLPLMVWRTKVVTREAVIFKQALVLSILLLLVVNFSQASWEASVIRVWIYSIIGFGMLIIRNFDSRQKT